MKSEDERAVEDLDYKRQQLNARASEVSHLATHSSQNDPTSHESGPRQSGSGEQGSIPAADTQAPGETDTEAGYRLKRAAGKNRGRVA